MTKPFNPRELVAHVRAVLRRSTAAEPMTKDVIFGDLVISFIRHEVLVDGQPANLTPTEFRLLEALVREPGRAFSRSELLDRAFGYNYEGVERTVDVHIMNLRRKIERSPGRRYIATVSGLGYRFRETTMWGSLRVRLLLSTILVVLVAVSVIAFVATRRTEGEFQRYVERRSPLDDRRLGYLLAKYYEQHDGWAGVESEVERLGQVAGQQVVLIDAQGKVIADSDDKLQGRDSRTSLGTATRSDPGERRFPRGRLYRPAGRAARPGRGLHLCR